MLKFLPLVRERMGLFIAGLLTAIGSGLFTAKVIFIIKEGLEQKVDLNFLLAIIIYSVLATSVGILSSYFLAKITNIISRELTKNLSNNILEAEYQYIEDTSEKIVPVMTRDIRLLTVFINKFPQFIIATTTIIITLGNMLFIDLELTLYFLVIFVMQAVLLIILVPFVKRYNRKAYDFDNKVYGGLSNMVSGLKELTLNKMKRDAFIGHVIIDNLKKMTGYHIRARVIHGMSERLTELFTYVFMGTFMFMCFNYIDIDFERFKIFLPIVLFVVPLMGKISGFIRDSKDAEIALNQIQNLGLNIAKKKIDSTKSIPSINTELKNIIEFKNVTYSYVTSQYERPLVFGPLNLVIEQAKTTFIIGGNGSGKTTFAKLFTGLYIPTEGEIIYNGSHSIFKDNVLAYRQLFSAYFADSFTFKQLHHVNDDFLNENGAKFLDLLEMSDKVSIDHKEFTSTKMSYGQRSRLALVANMLDDKPIYLFDEWAANQDPYFKSIFYKDILPFLQKSGKTVVVISHDEKYFEHADNIIELKEGMVC